MYKFLKILIAIAIFFVSVYYFIPTPRASAQTIHLTACGTLTQANTIYILDNDVFSTGTCFSIAASGITLDLNGHTITFGTEPANLYCRQQWDSQMATGNLCVFGVAVPPHYSRRDLFPDPAIPDSAFSGFKDNLLIKNGKIFQGAGKATQSSPIYLLNARGLEISGLEIRSDGNDTIAINIVAMEYSQDVKIHDNRIYPNNNKTTLKHYGGFSVISLGGRGGQNAIYNNYIEGKGMSGIGADACKNFGTTGSTLKIYGNTVKMNAIMVDGYAVSIGGTSAVGGCEDGFEIYNNTIQQSNGRGIYASGYVYETDYGPGNGQIYGNYIEVKEGPDPEYVGTPGRARGIRVRFGAHNIKVFNNTIIGHAGLGVCPTPQGSDCHVGGIYISSGKPYGSGNEIYNNTITVDTNDASMPATGIEGGGSDGANDTWPVLIYGNRITSNNRIVRMAHGDGFGNNYIFRSNTFVKAPNPIDFHTVQLGWWVFDSLNETFLDTISENGADIDDVFFGGSQEGTRVSSQSFTIKWYLETQVKDAVGSPVSSTSISVKNNTGTEIFTGTTDATGKISQIEIPEYFKSNISYATPVLNVVNYNPYTISAFKNGISKSSSVTMDSSKSVTLILSELSDTTPPSAPTGVAVN